MTSQRGWNRRFDEPIVLPGGWYRLRVAVPGRLSENYQLLVEQGRHRTITIGCNDRQLWEPRPTAGVGVTATATA